jgi:2-C-methyl-D-erythritol 2,4-cyclodiphosphate synthase
MRIGIGYDVHKLSEGRKLVLGGVHIPFEKGLSGHSDADVLIHSLMDALLGALNLGDIGQHFPDDDKEYKDISSIILLSRVYELIFNRGYKIVNTDSVLIAQRPKLKEYLPKMAENICRECFTSIDRISIKATTTEELGFEGRGEGIAAKTVCLLEEMN